MTSPCSDYDVLIFNEYSRIRNIRVMNIHFAVVEVVELRRRLVLIMMLKIFSEYSRMRNVRVMNIHSVVVGSAPTRNRAGSIFATSAAAPRS